jgi:hypothetical protein
LEFQFGPEEPDPLAESTKRPVKGKRKDKFDHNLLNGGQRNALNRDRELTFNQTWDQVLAFIDRTWPDDP